MANETGVLRLPPIDGKDAPHEVVPVEGWKLKGEHGHMAFDATKAGRLVSLAELVTWLMETSDLPCSMAVDAVCEKLGAPEATGWLYLVSPGVLARPLKADDCFAWWVVAYGAPGLNPEYHGITGAMCNMRSMWGASASPSECNYIGHENLDPLAIRMDKAHALWGWGKVENEAAASSGQLTDWPALLAYRKANPGRDWGTGDQIAVGLAELKRRKETGQTESAALAAMAKEIGLRGGRESLRKPFKLLATDRMRAKKAAPATPVIKGKDGRKAA